MVSISGQPFASLEGCLPTQIGFILMDRFSMIAFAAVSEPLRIVNRLAGCVLYRLSLHSHDGLSCTASNGIAVGPDSSFEDAGHVDTLIVCGGIDNDATDGSSVEALLRSADGRGAMIGAVCTGTEILASAGLLDGYRATVHWEALPSLITAYPKVRFGFSLFEIDRRRMTCAGGTAATDMILAIISRDYGPDVASAVADQLIHTRIREAGEGQRDDLRAQLRTSDERVLKAAALMRERLPEPLSNTQLANAVGTSTRQLQRLFVKNIGCSPSKYYLNIRLEHARHLLQRSTRSLTVIAKECGLSSVSHLSKSYSKYYGRPPSMERKQGIINSATRKQPQGARSLMEFDRPQDRS